MSHHELKPTPLFRLPNSRENPFTPTPSNSCVGSISKGGAPLPRHLINRPPNIAGAITPVNAEYVGNELKNSKVLCDPCVIILNGCQVGLTAKFNKEKGPTWQQVLANTVLVQRNVEFRVAGVSELNVD